jgi:hypothetical protein
MKYKIITAFFLLVTAVSNAQLTANLILNPRPSARLADWALQKGTVTYLVSNIGAQGGTRLVKFKTELKNSDGSIVATTDLNKAPIVSIKDGSSVYDAGTVFPLEIQLFDSKTQNLLNLTGKISTGSYQLCVQMVEPGTYAALTPAQCKSFYLASAQLPILFMPANEQVLDIKKAQTAITFRWTPLVPKPQQSGVYYRLQVFEILDNQQPMQALRANQPLLDKNVYAQTQFIWQPQLSFINADISDSASKPQKFIWSVQTLDDNFNVIGNNGNAEGRSEPKVFTVGNLVARDGNDGENEPRKKKKGTK